MKKSSLFDKAEQHEALQGPIQLKDPNSFEFAYQQLYWIKVLYSSWNSSLRQWKDAVEKADEFRIYDRLPDPAHPYGSLDAMLKAEIGVMEAEGSRVIDARERSRLAAVNTTGEEKLPVGNPTGANQHQAKEEIDKLSNSSQSQRARENGVGHVTQKKIDRLARDFPEYHAKVRAGELSVHGACVAAGIAQRTVPLPLDPWPFTGEVVLFSCKVCAYGHTRRWTTTGPPQRDPHLSSRSRRRRPRIGHDSLHRRMDLRTSRSHRTLHPSPSPVCCRSSAPLRPQATARGLQSPRTTP
jgi:hypothetical protein